MEYLVTRDRILICTIKIFADYDQETGALIEEDLTDQDRVRMIIFMDGEIIDFRTGDVLSHIYEEEGFVTGEIYANTMYVDELFSADKVLTDEEFLYAQELYQFYLMRKKLIEEDKLRLFRQQRLY